MIKVAIRGNPTTGTGKNQPNAQALRQFKKLLGVGEGTTVLKENTLIYLWKN